MSKYQPHPDSNFTTGAEPGWVRRASRRDIRRFAEAA